MKFFAVWLCLIALVFAAPLNEPDKVKALKAALTDTLKHCSDVFEIAQPLLEINLNKSFPIKDQEMNLKFLLKKGKVYGNFETKHVDAISNTTTLNTTVEIEVKGHITFDVQINGYFENPLDDVSLRHNSPFATLRIEYFIGLKTNTVMSYSKPYIHEILDINQNFISPKIQAFIENSALNEVQIEKAQKLIEEKILQLLIEHKSFAEKNKAIMLLHINKWIKFENSESYTIDSLLKELNVIRTYISILPAISRTV